jgi:hypothetical protein
MGRGTNGIMQNSPLLRTRKLLTPQCKYPCSQAHPAFREMSYNRHNATTGLQLDSLTCSWCVPLTEHPCDTSQLPHPTPTWHVPLNTHPHQKRGCLKRRSTVLPHNDQTRTWQTVERVLSSGYKTRHKINVEGQNSRRALPLCCC